MMKFLGNPQRVADKVKEKLDSLNDRDLSKISDSSVPGEYRSPTQPSPEARALEISASEAKVSPTGGDLEGAGARAEALEIYASEAKVSPTGGDLEGAGAGTSFPYEHSTMPGWAGSSWYWYRYMDAHNDKEFTSKKAIAYWKDVDLYIGGSEHATGHLLYSRFWNKFLKDIDLAIEEEPFKKTDQPGDDTGAQ